MPRRHLKLVSDNSGRIARGRVFKKVRLELFKGVGRHPASVLDPSEKLAVVNNDLAEPRLRDAAVAAKALRLKNKALLQSRFLSHGPSSVVNPNQYEGYTPRLSRGYAPHEISLGLRDNSLMGEDSKTGLIDRITQCVGERGTTDRAASLNAGLSSTYIRDLKSGKIGSPTWSAIVKLAKHFQRDPCWLVTGSSAGSIDSISYELLSLFDRIPVKRQQLIIEMLAEFASEEAPSRSGRQTKRRSSN